MQATVGFSGLLVTVIYAYATDKTHAAPPSLGYTFNLTSDAGPMFVSTYGFAGTPGSCTDPGTNASTCDNYAYPVGDKVTYDNGMTDANAYAPFPNAIVLNWSTLFVLGLGNMCALDFQVGTKACGSPHYSHTHARQHARARASMHWCTPSLPRHNGIQHACERVCVSVGRNLTKSPHRRGTHAHAPSCG